LLHTELQKNTHTGLNKTPVAEPACLERFAFLPVALNFDLRCNLQHQTRAVSVSCMELFSERFVVIGSVYDLSSKQAWNLLLSEWFPVAQSANSC
jgi:hypothetical protein